MAVTLRGNATAFSMITSRVRQVWEALLKVWESIAEMEETPWSTAVPRKIRKSLDTVQEGMRNLPNRVRQYEPFDHAQVDACENGNPCC